MEEPRGCGPGVSTGVCRGGDRAGAHSRSLSSLTCGFPSHAWPSAPSTASATRLLGLGFPHFHPKDGCSYYLIACHNLHQTS